MKPTISEIILPAQPVEEVEAAPVAEAAGGRKDGSRNHITKQTA